jgi:rhamnosyltransferase
MVNDSLKSTDTETSLVSVVVPTLNAQTSLRSFCEAIRNQSQKCELIVVDSSSSDNTPRIAAALADKTITIRREDFSHGASRNLGAAAAKGNVLVFITQDALPLGDSFLKSLLNPLRQDGCAASYGRHLPGPEARPTEKFARLFNYPPDPSIKDRGRFAELGIKTYFLSNVCSAIRRDVFEKMGGFSAKAIMSEDLLFGAGLIARGYKIAYVPEAEVAHHHNHSLATTFRRYFDTGVVFSDYSDVLLAPAPARAARSFVCGELTYLMGTQNYRWLPYALAEIVSKYAGYQIGRRYRFVPPSVRKCLSNHRMYWHEG